MLKYEVHMRKIIRISILHYRHGEEHQVNRPSYVCVGGTMSWCQYGKQHRIDGPAVVWHDGQREFYKRGRSC